MKEITAGELKNKLEAGEAVAVLDIREAEEYADWHIHGSRNIPAYHSLNRREPEAFTAQIETLPRDRPIVTVCRMGGASKNAARILESLGYQAFSLIGGIRGWSEAWSEAQIPLAGRKDATLIQIRRNGKGCLSYLLGSKGQAAIVDPNVDAQVYKIFVQTILANLPAKPPNFQTVLAINEGKAELGQVDPLDLEAGPNRCAVR